MTPLTILNPWELRRFLAAETEYGYGFVFEFASANGFFGANGTGE
jgi:hypothetical protein